MLARPFFFSVAQEIATAMAVMERMGRKCTENWWKDALAVASDAAATSAETALMNVTQDVRLDAETKKKRIEVVSRSCAHAERTVWQ